MSEVKVYGKDTVVFASREDHAKPSTVTIPEPERPPGLILEDGSINWNCPCLGGMATGPCGLPFREAFTCFHYSTAEAKGSDCVEQFTRMQACMKQYPTLYSGGDDDDNEFGKREIAPEGSSGEGSEKLNVREGL